MLNSGGDTRAFIFPPKDIAEDYVKCFFEHASITFRYISRDQAYEVLDKVYQDDEPTLQDHTTMAMILLVMGCGQVSHRTLILRLSADAV